MSLSFLGQSNVNSGAATPYQRIIEPSQLGLYLNLEQAELLRVRRYHEHWRFYIGQHWTFTREDGEPLVTINYARALIDKSVSWLVAKGFTTEVPEAMREHTLPVLDEVWEYNRCLQLLYNMATLGAVTGDVFVLVTYEKPTPMAIRINPHTQGQIRIQLLGSEQVYPQWDPLNKDVLTAVRIETIYYDDRADTMEEGHDQQARQLHTRRFSQIITADAIIEQYQGQEPITRPNLLGEIPLIHIKNLPVPDEYYGLGDLDSIMDLNRELNEKCTDVSDIVNYHAAPVTVVQGAKVKNLERSAKNIWSGLPADAKVYNLEMGGSLGPSVDYIKMMKEFMLEIGGIPEGSLGKQQPISNTSGVALHTQYQPLVEKTNRKKAFYEPGIDEINYYILRIKELIDPTFRMPTDLCKSCGGRVVELTDAKGNVKKKCYRVDPVTFEFLEPDEVEIKAVRQHSFGTSTEEMPFDQIRREHGRHAPSAWDPEDETSAEDRHAEVSEQRTEAETSAAATSPGEEGGEPQTTPAESYTAPPLAKSDIDLPAEPEQINLRTITVDEAGVETTFDTVTTVVPTGCKRAQYMNPYYCKTTLNDTVPKDKALQASLFEQYQRNGWVSAEWVRERIPEIDDPEQEAKRVKDAGGAPGAGTSGNGGGAGGPQDPTDRTAGPPFGANLPKEGNA